MRQFIHTLRNGLAGRTIAGAGVGVDRDDSAADILHILAMPVRRFMWGQ